MLGLVDERVKFAVQPLVSDLLGVIDALHGAIEGLKEGEHERRVAEGLRLVEKELFEVLGQFIHRKFEILLLHVVDPDELNLPDAAVAHTIPSFS